MIRQRDLNGIPLKMGAAAVTASKWPKDACNTALIVRSMQERISAQNEHVELPN